MKIVLEDDHPVARTGIHSQANAVSTNHEEVKHQELEIALSMFPVGHKYPKQVQTIPKTLFSVAAIGR